MTTVRDIEIEKRYFVIERVWNDLWNDHSKPPPIPITQFYLSQDPACTIRVRFYGRDEGFLTIKGLDVGGSHPEVEIPITWERAEAVMRMFPRPTVKKCRFLVRVGDHLWEVDEFTGELDGVKIAEIELRGLDEVFDLPPWAGREITGVPELQNANLLANVALVRQAYEDVQRLYAQAHP